jgi:hypothetical protein
MALALQDVTSADQARAFGSLALIAPLLQRLGPVGGLPATL